MTTKSKVLLLAAGAALGFFAYRRRWSLLHNCVAHPLEVLFEGSEMLDRFHDWTGERWGRDE